MGKKTKGKSQRNKTREKKINRCSKWNRSVVLSFYPPSSSSFFVLKKKNNNKVFSIPTFGLDIQRGLVYTCVEEIALSQQQYVSANIDSLASRITFLSLTEKTQSQRSGHKSWYRLQAASKEREREAGDSRKYSIDPKSIVFSSSVVSPWQFSSFSD